MLATAHLLAAEPGIPLRIEVRANAPATATLRARPLGEGEVFARTVEVPWEGRLPIDPGRAWRIEVQSEGFWSAPAEWPPPAARRHPSADSGRTAPADAGSDGLTVVLYPLSRVAGRLKDVDSAFARPLTLGFNLHGPAVRGTASMAASGKALCPVERTEFRCDLPAGTLDLKISATGFVPEYYWDLEVLPGIGRDLGEVELTRGASIAGWMAHPENLLFRGLASGTWSFCPTMTLDSEACSTVKVLSGQTTLLTRFEEGE